MADVNGQFSGLDFERPIVELERRIVELETFAQKAGIDMTAEIDKLRIKCEQTKREIYANLTPWQRVQLAREPNRPDSGDYVAMMFEEVVELHGDQAVADDPAILTALVKLGKHRLMLVAQRKGRNTRDRMRFNFGSPHPEGYRKALLKMKLAEKFKLPVVSFVNTPGAYPGIGAEERGQANVIARNLEGMARLKTPTVSVVIGEGGSGGALGICLADRLAILEHAYFSVISPEGCAAILWRDGAKAPLAAELLRLTPRDLIKFGIVDEIIPEPLGGAHRFPRETADILADYLDRTLTQLKKLPPKKLLDRRYERHRRIGCYQEWVLRLATTAAPGSAEVTARP
jgi:acetyl-CoA carboxylase carboxyl transferase subunit alpha